ncbi:hypothetical protein FN846DRAFT_544167 [Sphaerosporella brunnea]|uniref:Uncharacterized protein n=1 Tax=Sphaerosporella brunnea TaxID=1250544 RepID=A0A5J5F3Y0_9PEZI|nr:hypothetical protein FN846DRAFT_544167 [Sphaerosporella brunnea]
MHEPLGALQKFRARIFIDDERLIDGVCSAPIEGMLVYWAPNLDNLLLEDSLCTIHGRFIVRGGPAEKVVDPEWEISSFMCFPFPGNPDDEEYLSRLPPPQPAALQGTGICSRPGPTKNTGSMSNHSPGFFGVFLRFSPLTALSDGNPSRRLLRAGSRPPSSSSSLMTRSSFPRQPHSTAHNCPHTSPHPCRTAHPPSIVNETAQLSFNLINPNSPLLC